MLKIRRVTDIQSSAWASVTSGCQVFLQLQPKGHYQTDEAASRNDWDSCPRSQRFTWLRTGPECSEPTGGERLCLTWRRTGRVPAHYRNWFPGFWGYNQSMGRLFEINLATHDLADWNFCTDFSAGLGHRIWDRAGLKGCAKRHIFRVDQS